MNNRDIAALLICPACKHVVTLEAAAVVCTHCSRRYPIRDGIPVMLIEEAVVQHSQREGK